MMPHRCFARGARFPVSGLRDDQRMLYESLEEEKRADAQLTTLAKGEVNQDSVSAFVITPG